MTYPNDHIIKKQLIDLHISSKLPAFETQKQFQEVFKRRVLPLMQALMDDLGPMEEVVQIEKLEVDLGKISALDMQEALPERVKTELGRQLGQAISHATFSASGTHGARKISHVQGVKNLLRMFLQEGCYPWWVQGEIASPPALLAELVKQEGEELTSFFKESLQLPWAVKRLIYQFSDELLTLVAQSFDRSGESWGQWAKALIEKGPKVGWFAQLSPTERRFQIWEKAIRAGFGLGGVVAEKQLLEQWSQLIGSSPTQIGSVGPSGLEELKRRTSSTSEAEVMEFWKKLETPILALAPTSLKETDTKVPTQIPESISSESETPVESKESGEHITPDGQAEASTEKAIQEAKLREAENGQALAAEIKQLQQEVEQPSQENPAGTPMDTPQEKDGKVEWETTRPPTEADQKVAASLAAIKQAQNEQRQSVKQTLPLPGAGAEYYIFNAGLVILWPYLPAFFERLGLDLATNAADQARAAMVLQYLVTGEREMPENELLLNKILCGLAPSFPLELEFEPTPEEEERSIELLEAIIENWPAIKNSSLESIRESFLQREGKLEFSGEYYSMKVDRRTMDILVDQIPWGIRSITLTWMERYLYVDW